MHEDVCWTMHLPEGAHVDATLAEDGGSATSLHTAIGVLHRRHHYNTIAVAPRRRHCAWQIAAVPRRVLRIVDSSATHCAILVADYVLLFGSSVLLTRAVMLRCIDDSSAVS